MLEDYECMDNAAPVCPYCGTDADDDGDLRDKGELDCEKCEAVFAYTRNEAVTYNTTLKTDGRWQEESPRVAVAPFAPTPQPDRVSLIEDVRRAPRGRYEGGPGACSWCDEAIGSQEPFVVHMPARAHDGSQLHVECDAVLSDLFASSDWTFHPGVGVRGKFLLKCEVQHADQPS